MPSNTSMQSVVFFWLLFVCCCCCCFLGRGGIFALEDFSPLLGTNPKNSVRPSYKIQKPHFAPPHKPECRNCSYACCRTPPLHAHTQCQTQPLHAHTQFNAVKPNLCMFKAVEPHLCMPIPSSRLSNPASACPHPVQGSLIPPLHASTQFKPHLCMPTPSVKPNLCMPTPSSRLSNPASACPHPVQGSLIPPLHASTQFKPHLCMPTPSVKPNLCMPTPSSRLSKIAHHRWQLKSSNSTVPLPALMVHVVGSPGHGLMVLHVLAPRRGIL